MYTMNVIKLPYIDVKQKLHFKMPVLTAHHLGCEANVPNIIDGQHSKFEVYTFVATVCDLGRLLQYVYSVSVLRLH